MFKSIYIYKNLINIVYLKKNRNRYRFLKKELISLKENNKVANLIDKNYKNFVNYSFFNIENTRVEIPLVKDKKTKEVLIEAKLKNQDIDLNKFKYIPILNNVETDREIYNIYLIPYSIFKELNLEDKNLYIELFSLPIFSIFSISKKFFKEKNTLHIYSDKSQLIIVLNENENLKYFRTIEIPSHISYPSESYINFLYENINLTFNYIRQSISIKIDKIIISGLESQSEELANLIFNFAKLPLCSLTYQGFLENCSGEDFQQNIINIGNLFIDKSEHDIRPAKYIHDKNFYKISKVLIRILIFLIFILSIFPILKFKDIQKKQQEISTLEEKIKQSYIKGLMKVSGFSEKKSIYYTNYLKLINDAQTKNAIIALQKVFPILSLHKFNYIDSQVKDNSFEISIRDKIKFSNLLEINNFKKRFYEKLKAISKDYSITDNSKFDINKLEATIFLNVRGNL
ncbi:hypothetical protein [Hydrogenothermus marinus]|uniref:Uncharacterized protein n=1 Tax=Hydrogenothermus marinus TaxID=133270 RepID=A0A3M0BRS3_9AQUI|nr:hypothetical protein [Hydrogenothermus marinus]RMA97538.1 hypothetical protein CLV39_0152 [Hydrogenothermus marinus]